MRRKLAQGLFWYRQTVLADVDISEPASLRQARIGSDLQAARTCYDHLAGALGVALFDALLREGVLSSDLEATRKGSQRLGDLGVDVEEAAESRRAFARRCLDWSERR